MEREVSILKALWTTRGPVHFEGKFHTLSGAHIRPRPLQQPFQEFYLGGGSRQAWELSAKHSDISTCSGATCRSASRKTSPRSGRWRAPIAAKTRLGFGMRLQVICREEEEDAWEAADQLVRHAANGRSRR